MTIACEHITFGFGKNTIFKNFSMAFFDGGEEANPVMLLGASGCGKTTLLRLIAGLLRPQAGKISASGEAVPAAAVVFQEPRLLAHLTALENIMLVLESALGKAKARERARYFLRLCAMEDYADRKPAELSGGQRHRIALARAWSYPAPLILMDEPFQSLDLPLRVQLMDAVAGLLHNEKRFVVAVTHAPREALYMGKRVIVLGKAAGHPARVVLDVPVLAGKREFVSENSIALEKKLMEALSNE
ncbi:MAG: ABC transporter ATP-binding protein [Spirochaetaceae bacterium]|jgi:NitT/TauT family transport system ATP-binding protein|nr:ABC transporter ATP-binding protein [Spirochaetaceae bacterium]